MQKIYPIDVSKIGGLQKRAIKRSGIVLICTYLLLFLLIWPMRQLYEKSGGIYGIFLSPIILVFSLLGGARLIKQRYSSYQIILDENGIQSQTQQTPTKYIAWINVIASPQKSGVVYLDDKSISVFMRWWNGSGRIFVYPEMLNYDELLADIERHLLL